MYFTNITLRAECDTRSHEAGLNSEISVLWNGCLTKAKELILSHYSSIAGVGDKCILTFPEILALSEKQTTLSTMWFPFQRK